MGASNQKEKGVISISYENMGASFVLPVEKKNMSNLYSDKIDTVE